MLGVVSEVSFVIEFESEKSAIKPRWKATKRIIFIRKIINPQGILCQRVRIIYSQLFLQLQLLTTEFSCKFIRKKEVTWVTLMHCFGPWPEDWQILQSKLEPNKSYGQVGFGSGCFALGCVVLLCGLVTNYVPEDSGTVSQLAALPAQCAVQWENGNENEQKWAKAQRMLRSI